MRDFVRGHWEGPSIRVSYLRSQGHGGLLGVLGGVSLCKSVSQLALLWDL